MGESKAYLVTSDLQDGYCSFQGICKLCFIKQSVVKTHRFFWITVMVSVAWEVVAETREWLELGIWALISKVVVILLSPTSFLARIYIPPWQDNCIDFQQYQCYLMEKQIPSDLVLIKSYFEIAVTGWETWAWKKFSCLDLESVGAVILYKTKRILTWSSDFFFLFLFFSFFLEWSLLFVINFFFWNFGFCSHVDFIKLSKICLCYSILIVIHSSSITSKT